MKLFVDDIRNPPDESWNVARTVSAAIRAIAQFDFDEISLDHDISHQVSVGELSRPYPCEETFQPVAYFIGEKYTKVGIRSTKLPRVILHTSNPVGGAEMSKILQGYGLKCEKKYMGIANRLELEV